MPDRPLDGSSLRNGVRFSVQSEDGGDVEWYGDGTGKVAGEGHGQVSSVPSEIDPRTRPNARSGEVR